MSSTVPVGHLTGPRPKGAPAASRPGRPRSVTLAGLRRFNGVMALLHLVQAGAILALSSAFALPVTASFLQADPAGGLTSDPRVLFDVRIGPLVAAFLVLSAIAHAVVATVGARRYEADLERGINRARWIEYALSSSLMIVVIAMLVGMYDVAALLLIFAANASMILFGWVMEVHNQTTRWTDWLSYWFGVFAGAIPWVAIGIYLFGPTAVGNDGPPGFVYGIFGSIFVFFNVFALNMVLQYRRVGRWRDYLYGERVYVLLSLTAKSALAWQVFAGTLRPN
ncbi:MAG TPA: heliorhodopsin HeR [Actinomycetota bacterium]|nr:heliorhodopsin HeR [Actinomycetota bacterium]